MNRYMCSIAQYQNAPGDNEEDDVGTNAFKSKINYQGDVSVSAKKIHTTILNNKIIDLESIQAHQLVSDEKYEDKDFLPIIESITSNVQKFPIAQRVTWQRIDRIILDNEIKVFSGKIEPNDIFQGALGDCYFLSALSTLAEHPDLISRLFDTTEYNPSGFYSVWLNHDGMWKQIIIDDYFPCINNKPAFSKSNGNELWVMILEKAYANLFKNYYNIQAGLPEQAVADLTGSPHEYIFTKDVEEVWEFIYTKVEDEKVNPKVKYILNAGSNSDSDGGIEVKDETGIISGHAYAVLDAKIVTSRDGEERIVQLRNPWGQSEWQGAWSDKSDKWTPQLKQLCNYSNKNDGLFWMPIEDFCKKYSNISCNYLYIDNYYNSIKADFSKGKYAVVSFRTVGKSSTGYIQFHQQDRRNFKGINDNYDYSMVRALIFSGTPNNVIQYVGDVVSYQRNGFIKVNLVQKGDYFVIIQVNWQDDTTRQLVISSYTDKEVYFTDQIIYHEELSFLDNCLSKIPPKKKGEEHVYKEDSQIFRYSNSTFGYLYFVYVNQSSSATLKETLFMTKLQHLQICPPYHNTSQCDVEVKPKETKVVKYRILPEGNGGYSYSLGSQSKLILSKDNLIERIVESASNMRARKVNGVEVQVFFYSMFHSDGCAFYFQNKTNKTYCEQLKLTLINLVSEDGINTTDIIKFEIPPNSGKLFKFKEIVDEDRASFKMSYAAYFKEA